jgi:hypothetical protein
LIFGICLPILLAALCIPASLARKDRNLLLAIPDQLSSSKIDVFEIEDFNTNEFLLTYEIHYPERINLSYAEFPVTLTGTNSVYPQILKYSMLEGSFFSSQAWAGKLRHAVLNEKAAFEIFGSRNITGNHFKIQNDTWLVTGVIRDGNDNHSRIYIPSSLRNEKAGALAMISGIPDETYMKNSLKTLGVREGDFDYINFNTLIRRLWERIVVLIFCLTGFFILSMLKPLIILFNKTRKIIKIQMTQFYLLEIFQKNKKLILKGLFFTLGLVILPCFVLTLFINITAICLPWQDIVSIGKVNFSFFNSHLERIFIFELVSNSLFILSIVIICVFFIFSLRRKSKPDPNTCPGAQTAG